MFTTPFTFGKIATGDDFTDRERESERIKQNLSSGVNTILISPRRWGKSSLIHKVANSCQNDRTIRFCFIDLFNIRTEQEFYESLIRQLIRVTATKWEDRIKQAKKFFKKIIPRFSVGLDPNSEFSVSLDWKEIQKAPEEILDLAENIAKTKKIRIILCIDEFQNVAFFEDPLAFQKKLRAHWQHHQHATYCMYGSKRHMLIELFSSPSMPFYKFGDTIFLEKIPTNYWIKFIVARFKDTNKTISPGQAGHIADLMENHPYFVQQLAQTVWFRTEKNCTEKIIADAIESLLTQHSILFQREIDQLTNSQINFLKALCDDVRQLSSQKVIAEYRLGSSSNVNIIKTALEKKEIIDSPTPGINFIDPLFKLWLKNIYFKDARHF